MDVTRLRVKSGLQLLVLCHRHSSSTGSKHLYHSSQHWNPYPLIEVRDPTLVLMDISPIHFPCTTPGTPTFYFWIMFNLYNSSWLFKKYKSSGCLWFKWDWHLNFIGSLITLDHTCLFFIMSLSHFPFWIYGFVLSCIRCAE